MGNTEDFIHARGDGVNRGGTTDFVFKFWGEFFAASSDSFAFFTIGIPSVFFFGAGFLAESGEGDLAEAVFDNFVAWSEFVFFPEAEFFGGLLDGFGDFCYLVIGQRVIIDLLPFHFFFIKTVILGALSHEKMEMA